MQGVDISGKYLSPGLSAYRVQCLNQHLQFSMEGSSFLLQQCFPEIPEHLMQGKQLSVYCKHILVRRYILLDSKLSRSQAVVAKTALHALLLQLMMNFAGMIAA